MTDEASGSFSTALPVLNAITLGFYNFSQAQSDRIASFYPINISDSDPSGTGNFQLSSLEAYRQGLASFGEGGITGSEGLANRAMCQHGACDTTWSFRFDAPTVGTKFTTVPLAPVVHSADHSYLRRAMRRSGVDGRLIDPHKTRTPPRSCVFSSSPSPKNGEPTLVLSFAPETQKLDSARQ